MSENSTNNENENTPKVEIHVDQNRLSAAASGQTDTKLSDAQISVLQSTLTTLATGFQPPKQKEDDGQLSIKNVEIELSFKLTTGSGGVLKLLFDASTEASIKAKIVWGS